MEQKPSSLHRVLSPYHYQAPRALLRPQSSADARTHSLIKDTESARAVFRHSRNLTPQPPLVRSRQAERGRRESVNICVAVVVFVAEFGFEGGAFFGFAAGDLVVEGANSSIVVQIAAGVAQEAQFLDGRAAFGIADEQRLDVAACRSGIARFEGEFGQPPERCGAVGRKFGDATVGVRRLIRFPGSTAHIAIAEPGGNIHFGFRLFIRFGGESDQRGTVTRRF